MSFAGTIENGAVVLTEPLPLPNGTPVTIAVATPALSPPTEDPIPSLYERLKPFIGCLDGLPEDAAANHDHYLYCTPKRS